MLATEALKLIMGKQSVTPAMLRDRLGIKPTTLSQRFTQKNISVDKLHEMLRAMDYKIVLVPRNTRLADNEIEITSESATSATPTTPTTPTIEERLRAGEISFDEAVAQGWKPTKEMLDKLLS